MEVILELLGRVIFELLLGLPGALVRWLYFKLKKNPKSFKDILETGIYLNVVLTILIIVFVLLIINI